MVRITGLTLLIAALCTLLLTTPVLAEQEGEYQLMRISCLKKDWRIVNAIDQLCRKNLHMPGTDAQLGVSFDGGRNKVSVTPNRICEIDGRINQNSNIWIPQYWCERQFWKTCAQGNAQGRGMQTFGGRGCQRFWISDFRY